MLSCLLNLNKVASCNPGKLLHSIGHVCCRMDNMGHTCMWYLQVDRLGDAKQQVRNAAATALQTIMQSWGLQVVLPMLASTWGHRNPRVKQGTLQAVTDTIMAMPVALSLPAAWVQLVLQPATKLLDDANRCACLHCMLTSYWDTDESREDYSTGRLCHRLSGMFQPSSTHSGQLS